MFAQYTDTDDLYQGGGRVFFTVPNLFEASLSLRGALPNDGWFFGHTTFLFTIGGDRTGLQGTCMLGASDVDLHGIQMYPQTFPVNQRTLSNVSSLTRLMHALLSTFPSLPQNHLFHPVLRYRRGLHFRQVRSMPP
jgi:hypothetical protein